MYLCNRLDVIRVGDSLRSFPKAMGTASFLLPFLLCVKCASNSKNKEKENRETCINTVFRDYCS